MFQTILTCQYGRDNFEEYTEDFCTVRQAFEETFQEMKEKLTIWHTGYE